MADEYAEMQRVFDAPTRFTLDSLRVDADPYRESVSVQVKDGVYGRADHYLQTQIKSGTRRQKAFERALHNIGILQDGWKAVPGPGATIDEFGNMRRAEIKAVLAWFDAHEQGKGKTKNLGDKGRAKKRKGTKRELPFEYFYAAKGVTKGSGAWLNGRRQNLREGIYRKLLGADTAKLLPVVYFVPVAKYDERFDFYGVGKRSVEMNFPKEFDAYLRKTTPRVLP